MELVDLNMADEYRQDSWNKFWVNRAFVLMNTNIGSEKQVMDDAKGIGCVKEAYLCYGTYDLILKIESSSMEELKDLLTQKLRKIENVRSVLSLFLPEENEVFDRFLTPAHTPNQ